MNARQHRASTSSAPRPSQATAEAANETTLSPRAGNRTLLIVAIVGYAAMLAFLLSRVLAQ